MDRRVPSASRKKPLLPLAPEALAASGRLNTGQRRKKKTPTNPLKDHIRVPSRSCSSASETSSTSIEPPRGCLKFLIPYSSSSAKTPVGKAKYLTKTPNSAPNALPSKPFKSNPSKENISKVPCGGHPKSSISEKVQRFRKNSPCLHNWQSGKKYGPRIGQCSSKTSCAPNTPGYFLTKSPYGSEETKQGKVCLERISGDDSDSGKIKFGSNDAKETPLVKIAARKELGATDEGDAGGEKSNTSTTKTPPIQASLSPEIQCGTSFASTTTPVCYGAGYVVSGVIDKRKCKPRGILTIEENNFKFDHLAAFDCFDEDDRKVAEVDKISPSSLFPLPNEASMLWHQSPCSKGDEARSEKSESGSDQSRGLLESTTRTFIFSPSSGCRFSSDIGDGSVSAGATCFTKRNWIASSHSPLTLPEYQELLDSPLPFAPIPISMSPHSRTDCKAGASKEGRRYCFDFIDGNSPLSAHSLSRGNVIQTPQSDSSEDLHVDSSLVPLVQEVNKTKPDFDWELNSVSEVQLSSDPDNHEQLGGSLNSSFWFDSLILPLDSIDHNHLPKIMDDQDPWSSNSSLENLSQSLTRISWREGLMNRMYEIDEFDCCRCFSDEEEKDAKDCSSEGLIPVTQITFEKENDAKLNADYISPTPESDDYKNGIDKAGEEIFPPGVSCAESISTDGGSLFASRDDSDWNLCYKNELFQA